MGPAAVVADEGAPLAQRISAAGGPLRIGVIGTGAMGKEHCRNIALLGEDVARVVAIADPFEPSRQEALKDLASYSASGEISVFERVADLLASDTVDAVVVCAPNFCHIEVLRQAIPTNKHILCEKPLCISLEECAEVEMLLQERDAALGTVRPGIFMTGMEYRWMPSISQLLREVDSGSLGTVRTVMIREHRFPFLEKVANWNRFNRYTGGTLVEKACHFFDLMRRITQSEPKLVFASGSQAVNHKDEKLAEGAPDILDHAFVTVEFASGARAVLDLNMFAEDEQTEHVTAVCDLGKVEAKAPESTVRVLRRMQRSGLGQKPPAPHERARPEVRHLPVPEALAEAGYHEGATFHELQEFVLAARGLQKVPVSATDGKMAVLIGLAAQESIATGRAVRVGDGVKQAQPMARL